MSQIFVYLLYCLSTSVIDSLKEQSDQSMCNLNGRQIVYFESKSSCNFSFEIEHSDKNDFMALCASSIVILA